MNIRPSTIRGYAYGVLTGTLLTTSLMIAAPAKADIADGVSAEYAPAVCSVLDDGNASVEGIMGIGLALMGQGWTPREAGEIVGWSVVHQCPRYIPILRAFVARYGTKQAVA